MPQYLLGVMHDDDYDTDVDLDSPEIARIHTKVMAFNEKITAEGQWVFGAGLLPASSATVVRSTDGQVAMTDGPYAETKEQMGGFWVIEAPDLDAALAIAADASDACEGPVEVRPMQGG